MQAPIEQLAQKAKAASIELALLSTERKNSLLLHIAESLSENKAKILKANRADVEDAKKSGLSLALIDRLSLEGRLDGIITDVRHVATLKDPVGEILESREVENGLLLTKKRVPIGVLGVIYEARPNVTVDVATLALKTGNSAILRGGSETLRSNKALVEIIQKALKECGISQEAIQLIPSRSRALVKKLLKLDRYIDMIIPRGGAGLHFFCKKESTIPVITGGIGICHLFVDESADVKKSMDVIHNAKTQRPSVCNALDTLLVHKKIASVFLPEMVKRLQACHVVFRLDPSAQPFLPVERAENPHVFQEAIEKDWDTEWMSLVLGIKVVDSLDEAIAHIQKHGSGHSDGILTENKAHAALFVQSIDSASLYINASTRFTDGGQYGLGAEVAISTQKLHARGPMGLQELTTYKWIVEGNYHIRK